MVVALKYKKIFALSSFDYTRHILVVAEVVVVEVVVVEVVEVAFVGLFLFAEGIRNEARNTARRRQ